jgi:hypothetical protein
VGNFNTRASYTAKNFPLYQAQNPKKRLQSATIRVQKSGVGAIDIENTEDIKEKQKVFYIDDRIKTQNSSMKNFEHILNENSEQ